MNGLHCFHQLNDIWECHSDHKRALILLDQASSQKGRLGFKLWLNDSEPLCVFNDTGGFFTWPLAYSCALACVIRSTVSPSSPGGWPQYLEPEHRETCSEKLMRMAVGRSINTSPDWGIWFLKLQSILQKNHIDM